MKKILYVLQQSIFNNDAKWLTADSNIQMMIGIINELLEKTDWEFEILISKISTFADIKSYDEIIKNPRVKFIGYTIPPNPFLLRQHFDTDFWAELFIRGNYDIIWNNITEISRNIKTTLWYLEKAKTKLITCCYWLDCPLIDQEKIDTSVSYMWRQFDGFECSDLAVFTCQSTYDAWIKNSQEVFHLYSIDKILYKSTIWNFGYSEREIQKYKTINKFEKKTILFLNRLSGINYTHHEEFIEAVNILAEKRDDFQVIFTNPSQKISWDKLKEKVKNIYIYKKDSLNREEYCTLLWKADISVHLFEKELFGGCAFSESIEAENLIVCPKINEYKNILGYSYPYYTNINPVDIAETLNRTLDNKTNKYWIDRNKSLSSFEVISNGVIEDINKMYG